jgi:Ferritin-like domain
VPKFKFDSLLCPGEKVTAEQLATDRSLLAFEKTVARMNRRGFLGVLTGAAALGALGGLGAVSAKAQSTATPSISDVLNFALNFEYLQANFYSIVATGNPISATLSGTPTGALAGSPGKLNLDVTTLALANALAQDEANHITQLRTAITSLGGTPVAQPAINYGAAGSISTQAQFLTTARQFAALSSSAYAGSAAVLVSNTSVLATVAQILGAEGQHAGAINFQCIAQGITSAPIDAQDVPPATSQYFMVSLSSGLAPERSTSQALGVAYGISTASTTNPAVGTTMGGFFPSGLNGNIKST